MARRTYTKKNLNTITCYGGQTWITTDDVDAIFKPRWWFFQIQPKLLLPSLRRGNRKIVIVNGRRLGWAELRSGWIPLERYKLLGPGLPVRVANVFRKLTGWGCKYWEKGYALVKLSKLKFIVTYRFTKDRLLVGEAYDLETEFEIGKFTFTHDFSEVIVHSSGEGVHYTMQVLAAYVADGMVYSLVADQLNRQIKIRG